MRQHVIALLQKKNQSQNTRVAQPYKPFLFSSWHAGQGTTIGYLNKSIFISAFCFVGTHTQTKIRQP